MKKEKIVRRRPSYVNPLYTAGKLELPIETVALEKLSVPLAKSKVPDVSHELLPKAQLSTPRLTGFEYEQIICIAFCEISCGSSSPRDFNSFFP